MLRAQATKDALHAGDVPYWTRQGNTVFGEDGAQQIAALAHPRLDTQANIAARANALRLRPYLLNMQFMHLLNGISGRLITEHQIQRQLAGHGPPNY